jgi:hypothetical protein
MKCNLKLTKFLCYIGTLKAKQGRQKQERTGEESWFSVSFGLNLANFDVS